MKINRSPINLVTQGMEQFLFFTCFLTEFFFFKFHYCLLIQTVANLHLMLMVVSPLLWNISWPIVLKHWSKKLPFPLRATTKLLITYSVRGSRDLLPLSHCDGCHTWPMGWPLSLIALLGLPLKLNFHLSLCSNAPFFALEDIVVRRKEYSFIDSGRFRSKQRFHHTSSHSKHEL